MAKLELRQERCKSCEFCINACPKKALKMGDVMNKSGYNFVEVDHSKCIQCGICYTVCPDGVFQIVN